MCSRRRRHRCSTWRRGCRLQASRRGRGGFNGHFKLLIPGLCVGTCGGIWRRHERQMESQRRILMMDGWMDGVKALDRGRARGSDDELNFPRSNCYVKILLGLKINLSLPLTVSKFIS